MLTPSEIEGLQKVLSRGITWFDIGFDQNDSSRIGEKWLDSEYILKVQQIKFVGGLNIWYERNNVVKVCWHRQLEG